MEKIEFRLACSKRISECFFISDPLFFFDLPFVCKLYSDHMFLQVQYRPLYGKPKKFQCIRVKQDWTSFLTLYRISYYLLEKWRESKQTNKQTTKQNINNTKKKQKNKTKKTTFKIKIPELTCRYQIVCARRVSGITIIRSAQSRKQNKLKFFRRKKTKYLKMIVRMG